MQKKILTVDYTTGHHRDGHVSFHMHVHALTWWQLWKSRQFHRLHTAIEKIVPHRWLDKYEWHGWKLWKREWWLFGDSYYQKTGHMRMPICPMFDVWCDHMTRSLEVAHFEVRPEVMDKVFPVGNKKWRTEGYGSWVEYATKKNGPPPAEVEER